MQEDYQQRELPDYLIKNRMTMFEKIISAIKMVFEALINLHHIFAPKKDDTQDKETQDNNP